MARNVLHSKILNHNCAALIKRWVNTYLFDKVNYLILFLLPTYVFIGKKRKLIEVSLIGNQSSCNVCLDLTSLNHIVRFITYWLVFFFSFFSIYLFCFGLGLWVRGLPYLAIYSMYHTVLILHNKKNAPNILVFFFCLY